MSTKTHAPDEQLVKEVLADLAIRQYRATPEVVADTAGAEKREELAAAHAAVGLITEARPKLAARVAKAQAVLDDLAQQLASMDDRIESVAPKWKKVRA